jgi:hypothetical protein
MRHGPLCRVARYLSGHKASWRTIATQAVFRGLNKKTNMSTESKILTPFTVVDQEPETRSAGGGLNHLFLRLVFEPGIGYQTAISIGHMIADPNTETEYEIDDRFLIHEARRFGKKTFAELENTAHSTGIYCLGEVCRNANVKLELTEFAVTLFQCRMPDEMIPPHVIKANQAND